MKANFYGTLRYLVCFFLMAMPLASNAAPLVAMTGQLNLLATLNGEPAFKPVSWKLENQTQVRTPDMTLNRHSAVLDLKPGKYRVTVTMDNATKTAVIVIKEGGKHQLIMDLD